MGQAICASQQADGANGSGPGNCSKCCRTKDLDVDLQQDRAKFLASCDREAAGVPTATVHEEAPAAAEPTETAHEEDEEVQPAAPDLASSKRQCYFTREAPELRKKAGSDLEESPTNGQVYTF